MLATGFQKAAEKIAAEKSFSTWEKCEDSIAETIQQEGGGDTQEVFAARQVAADLCRVQGFIKNLAAGKATSNNQHYRYSKP